MTVPGGGGVTIDEIAFTNRFKRKYYARLTAEMKDRADALLRKLRQVPIPAGARFEKLKGYDDPPIYTAHLDGNYKLSMEIRL